jgi:hypothetical protein
MPAPHREGSQADVDRSPETAAPAHDGGTAADSSTPDKGYQHRVAAGRRKEVQLTLF